MQGKHTKRKKRSTLTQGLLILLLFACLILMGISSYHLYKEWNEASTSKSLYEEVQNQAIINRVSGDERENNIESDSEISVVKKDDSALVQETAPISVNFDILLQECADIVAWLYCPGTAINYPVAQDTDNMYYLRHLPNGEYNTSGTLFLDYRNNSDFEGWTSLIYGHNMKIDTMFGTLPEYREQSYYEAHPFLYLLTPEADYRIDVIGGFVISDDDPIYDTTGSKEERDALLKTVARKTEITTAVSVSDTDRIIALSTCSYDYENARYVLVGALRELQK